MGIKQKYICRTKRVNVWSVSPEIIEYDISGPFDRDFFHELETIEQNLLSNYRTCGHPWSSVVVISGSGDFTVLNEELMHAFLQQRCHSNYGQVSACHVIDPGVNGANGLRHTILRCYSYVDMACECFYDIADALMWTHKKLNDAHGIQPTESHYLNAYSQ